MIFTEKAAPLMQNDPSLAVPTQHPPKTDTPLKLQTHSP